MSSLIVDVAKIAKIEPHPNADRLRIATVKGWKCIIGLSDFNEGDLIVFIPPESVLPDELIAKYKLDFVKKGGRVRTVKLRGFISQGLCLPVPEGKNWKEGKNVAEEMGIKKYEPPTRGGRYGFNAGRMVSKKKLNPLFDKYTDIENIKNFNTVFEEGEMVVITEKIHGTNFRAGRLPVYPKSFWGWVKKYIFRQNYEFCYGSHNVQKKPFSKNKGYYGEDVYGQIAKRYKLADIIPNDYIVYGEIYGKKIQELEYGMDDIDLVVFDIKYKGKYLNWEDVIKFCEERKLPVVPVLYIGKYSEEIKDFYTQTKVNFDVEAMQFFGIQGCYYVSGKSVLAKSKGLDNQISEGCVIKPLEEVNNARVGRKILKSINDEYLLTKNRTEYH